MDKYTHRGIPAGRYKVTKTLYAHGSVRFHPDAVIEFYPSTGNLVAFHLQGQRVNVCTNNTCYNFGKGINVEGVSLGSDLQAGDIVFLQGDIKANPKARDYDTIRDVIQVESVSGSLVTFANRPEYNYDRVTIDKFIPVENVILDGINVKCMTFASGSDGIRVDYGHHVDIRNCHVENFDNAQICAQYCLDTHINNNYCAVDYADQLQYGVLVWGGRKVVVHGNTVTSKRTAIDVTRLATEVTITGNSVLGHLNTHSSSNVNITGNNVVDGMILIRGKNCIVNGNTVQSYDMSCIDIEEMGVAGGHIISNNIFRGYVYMKMYTSGITLANNHFFVDRVSSYTSTTGTTISTAIRFLDCGTGGDKTLGATITGNRFEFVDVYGEGEALYCMETIGLLPTINNITVMGNVVKGFKSGINMAQNSNTVGQNLIIKDNIVHCKEDGILFRAVNNTQVVGNTVVATSKGRYGILRYYLDGADTTGLVMTDNYVKNFQYGFYWWGSSDTKKVVYNDNVVVDCDNVSQGISGNTTRVNNEIFIASPDKSVYQIKVGDDGTITAVKQSWTA